MANDAGAGAGDGQPGSGAPGGGSPEGGSENDALDDKFERRIKAALASQKAHHDRELQSVKDQFDAFKAGGGGKKEETRQPPKRYTQADLKAAVDAQQITAEQSNEIWAKQVKDEAREEAVAAADEHVTQKQAKERIDLEIESYKRLKPEIMENGSDLREKITAEFKYLVSLGDPGQGPELVRTQLKAIRAVLGPLEKLERASSATRRQDHDEQSGGGGGENRQKTGNKLVDSLDSRTKAHYQKGIDAGRYKDWKEVEAELKFAKPTRRRAA